MTRFIFPFLTIILFCSFRTNSVEKCSFSAPVNPADTLFVNSGSFHNSGYQSLKVAVKNPFDYELILGDIAPIGEKEKVVWSYRHYGTAVSIPPKGSVEVRLEKNWNLRRLDTGHHKNVWMVKFRNSSHTIPVVIQSHLKRSETCLEIAPIPVDTIDKGETAIFSVDIKNTEDIPITIKGFMKHYEPDGVEVLSKMPITIKGKSETNIRIAIETDRYYSDYYENVYFETDEDILHQRINFHCRGYVITDQKPQIKFDSTVKTKHMMLYGNGLFEYPFTNTGNRPLIISTVKSSCGCLVPYYDREPVMPGERGMVKGKYDTKRIGPINKSLTVYTNISSKPYVLRLKGVVYRPEDSNLNGEK